jgi:hypothetical protein
MNPVLQHPTLPRPTFRLVPRVVPAFTLREVGYGYRPGGSLGLSILAHYLVVLVVLFLGRHAFVERAVLVKPQLDSSPSVNILVLPTLGGGTEGSGQEGGGQGTAGKVSSGLRARSQRGFAYPGSQPMVSNPPKATPGIQTILQPSLENLPRLRRLLELPNIVQPALPVAETIHGEPVLAVKPEQVLPPPQSQKPVAPPKITLPLARNTSLASLIESQPQLPHKAVPDPVEASEISAAGSTHAGLLVLNAVAPPPEITGTIPKAESRSLFAVSPAEATIIADPGAGTKSGGSPSMTAGTGGRNDITSGDALAEQASGGNKMNQGMGRSGTGNGGLYGSDRGRGLDSVSNSVGSGRGSGSGPGLGTRTSTGAGSGTGAGSAPGTGGFPGITIQGGRYGNSGNMLAKSDSHSQTSYTMTVVSTAGSGGGLPDLGVFRNEKVYTVYLDMRTNADDRTTPSWTLQYAVLRPAATSGRIQGTPTPPYAMLKEVPQFAPELLHKYARPLIVASAILNTGGKLENVSVKQSSENQLLEPLVEALKEWVFEPAKINGQPVALKILLGIRLPLPH